MHFQNIYIFFVTHTNYLNIGEESSLKSNRKKDDGMDLDSDSESESQSLVSANTKQGGSLAQHGENMEELMKRKAKIEATTKKNMGELKKKEARIRARKNERQEKKRQAELKRKNER